MIDSDTSESITKFYQGKVRFYLTFQVNAPYAGCYYEPNILYVDPVDKVTPIRPLYVTGKFSGMLCGLESPMGPARLIQLLDAGSIQHKISDIECTLVGDAPINDALGIDEHYWVQGVKSAHDQGISLTWRCPICDVAYSNEDLPEFTGYKGNGGVGVFMLDPMCPSCIHNGLCVGCEDDDPMHYNSDIAEGGYEMCEECTETLLKGNMCGNVDLHSNVELRLKDKKYELYQDDKKIEGLSLDQQKIKDKVSKLSLRTFMAFSEIILNYNYVVDCMEEDSDV